MSPHLGPTGDGDDDAGGWRASLCASLVLLAALAALVLWVVTTVKGK